MIGEQSLLQGRILKSLGGFYYVETAEGILETRARGTFRQQGVKPVAGDLCVVARFPGEEQNAVEEILPRKNLLVRPPLANVDTLFFIVSSVDPAPNYRILDQLLAVAAHKGIAAAIVQTKLDLHCLSELGEIYGNIPGISYFLADYQKKNSLEKIKEGMGGGLNAFCGNSGVGKSTLLNYLDPCLRKETAPISQKLGRGRHTTREVVLHPLQSGGYVADTPGFSSLEMSRRDPIFPEELPACFLEFRPFLHRCRFRDCSHTVESGCAILAAVEKGEIAKSRHASYRVLLEECRKQKDWEKGKI